MKIINKKKRLEQQKRLKYENYKISQRLININSSMSTYKSHGEKDKELVARISKFHANNFINQQTPIKKEKKNFKKLF